MNGGSLGLIWFIWDRETCLEEMKSVVIISRTGSHTVDMHGKRMWDCLNDGVDFGERQC